MDAKSADEANLRAFYKADAKNAGAPDPWNEIAQAMKLQRCSQCGTFRYPPGPSCPGSHAMLRGESSTVTLFAIW